jgi:hypothetical protein
LSKTAIRSRSVTNSGDEESVTASTNSKIDRFTSVSHQLGSGSGLMAVTLRRFASAQDHPPWMTDDSSRRPIETSGANPSAVRHRQQMIKVADA